MGLKWTDMNGLEMIGLNKVNRIRQGNKVFPYEEGYITSSDVFAVTSKIAKGGKSIGWILNLERNGEIEEVTEGELYELIQNPNKEQSREEFTEIALLFLLLSGEVFQRNVLPIGFTTVSSVDLLNPQLTDVNTVRVGTKYQVKDYTYDGIGTAITKEEVSFLKYANPTILGERTLRGLSPLVAGYLTLTGLNNNQEASASILENQGVAGILSNEGEYALKEDERKQQQGILDKLLSGVLRYGKILQAATKIKYTKLGLDPTQLKIIESKLMKFRDLCAIYDIKSILFSDPVNASFNNLTNAEKSYWINAAIPNTQLIVNNFNKGVVSTFNEKEFTNGRGKYFITLDIKSIAPLQADQKKEAEKDKVKLEGLNTLLNLPITTAGKVELLISEYGYTEENAKKIAAPAPIPPSNEGQ